MSSKGNVRKLVIHSKSDNKEIMTGKETDEIIDDFSNYFFKASKRISRINET